MNKYVDLHSFYWPLKLDNTKHLTGPSPTFTNQIACIQIAGIACTTTWQDSNYLVTIISASCNFDLLTLSSIYLPTYF